MGISGSAVGSKLAVPQFTGGFGSAVLLYGSGV